MALNITTPMTTLDGLQVPTSYARIEVRDGISGENLICGLSIFASLTAFESGKGALVMEDTANADGSPLPTYWVMPYSRTTDGTDILVLAHDYIQSQLDSRGISSTIVL